VTIWFITTSTEVSCDTSDRNKPQHYQRLLGLSISVGDVSPGGTRKFEGFLSDRLCAVPQAGAERVMVHCDIQFPHIDVAIINFRVFESKREQKPMDEIDLGVERRYSGCT
jgi:hypothetical protein